MRRARKAEDKSPIQTLRSHPSAIVTPAELVKYWRLTSAELREHIEGGALKAIRFGTGVFRIRTKDAIDFQRRNRIPRRQSALETKRRRNGSN
jgi:hypothetical protein